MKTANRPTYARVFLTEKSTKMVPQDSDDRKDQGMMEIGREVGQYVFGGTPQEERWEDMDASWTVTNITIKKAKYRGLRERVLVLPFFVSRLNHARDRHPGIAVDPPTLSLIIAVLSSSHCLKPSKVLIVIMTLLLTYILNRS